METSVAGVEFIKKCEGCSLTEYDDVGHRACGYGHDILPGEAFPNPITQEEADALLNKDLLKYETAVNRYLPLTQGQFDALVSFAYECGTGALRQLMSHGMDQIPYQLYHEDPDGTQHGWIHAGGAVLSAMIERRKGEIQLFTSE